MTLDDIAFREEVDKVMLQLRRGLLIPEEALMRIGEIQVKYNKRADS
jgi:hypothetical protein